MSKSRRSCSGAKSGWGLPHSRHTQARKAAESPHHNLALAGAAPDWLLCRKELTIVVSFPPFRAGKCERAQFNDCKETATFG